MLKISEGARTSENLFISTLLDTENYMSVYPQASVPLNLCQSEQFDIHPSIHLFYLFIYL